MSNARGSRLAPGACLVAGLLVAWLTFHPEAARPFDFLDFGEFLPYLKRTSNAWEQVISVIKYNAAQSGRANLVPVLAAVFKWQVFHDWTPGWQLMRAAVMAVLMVQTYLLALRVGASRAGAVAAAAIFILAPATARGWVRITMGEPMGMIAVLALSLRAFSYQARERWGLDVVLFCLTSVFIILIKELMAPVMAWPLVIALTRHGATYRWPQLSRRNVVLVLATGLVSIATMAPLVLLYLNASSNALASQYGAAVQPAAGIIAIWLATLVPFSLAQDAPSAMWSLAVISFIGLVVVGWAVGLRHGDTSANARRMLPWLLLFPLIGAIAYSPWPAYEERYAFPYLIATALFIGLAVTWVLRPTVKPVRVLLAGCVPIAAIALTGAHAMAARADAVQRAADGVIASVHTSGATDSVLVATPRAIVPEWTGLGPSIARLAGATDRPWPTTRDIRCADVPSRLRDTPGVTVVAFFSLCRGEFISRRVVAVHFSRMDWSQWRLAPDSIRADVFATARDMVRSTAKERSK